MKIAEVVHSPEYLLARQQGRQNRLGWREKQQKRYDREAEMADDERFRHIAKSQARYKPHAIPLIRFGLFRQTSQTFLMSPEPPEDERYDPDWQFARNEVGVSCYKGYWHGSYWEVLEPMTDRASYTVTRPFAPIYKFGKQMLDYIDHGKPMDIFLIYGHLKSFGKSQEYLSLGADGEYLLDTKQPYKMERLNPDIVYIGHVKLLDYYIWLYGGMDRYRRHFADDEDENFEIVADIWRPWPRHHRHGGARIGPSPDSRSSSGVSAGFPAEPLPANSPLFGPVFHKTNADIHSFQDFDLSKGSPSAALGPAIYCTFGTSQWKPGHLTQGRILKGYVRGRIIDLSKPLTDEARGILNRFIGKPDEEEPLFGLERRYGSLAAGLKAAGFAAAIHAAPGAPADHIAIFDPADIVDAN